MKWQIGLVALAALCYINSISAGDRKLIKVWALHASTFFLPSYAPDNTHSGCFN